MKNTKEAIVQVAYDMFLSNNYEAVTVNQIIKAAGITKGGLYHYFSSKEELFKTVVDRYIMESKIDIPLENLKLIDMVNYTIKKVNRHVECIVASKNYPLNAIPIQHISLITEALRYYPDYTNMKIVFFQKRVKDWQQVIENAIRNNEIKNDIDIEATTMNFLHAEAGIVANIILGNSVEYALNMYKRQLNEMYKCIKI
ncbi:MAG: TetR/AcrR family transcriptional regulator [Bacteroidales bacterium]